MDKRLPRKLLENGPRVVEGPDGTRQWVVEGRVWSGVGWAGVGRGPVNCYTRAGLPEEPEPGVFRAANAKYRCEDMDRDGVDAELVNGPYEQIAAIRDPELRIACVRAVNDWAREIYAESDGRFIMLLPLPCQTPAEAAAELLRVADFGLPTGVIFDWVNAPEPVLHQMWEPVWAAAAETGLPVNLHANPSGGSRQMGVGVTTAAPRNQALMRVANFPMGAMGELMSAVVFSGICDRHPGVRFVLEEAKRRLGAVPVLALRPRIRFRRTGQPRIQARHRAVREAHRVRQTAALLHLRGGGRGRLSARARNRPHEFPLGQRLPRARQPVATLKAMGHAPAEAALGKEALHQLVFDNAVNLYKIPVTLPQERALT